MSHLFIAAEKTNRKAIAKQNKKTGVEKNILHIKYHENSAIATYGHLCTETNLSALNFYFCRDWIS